MSERIGARVAEALRLEGPIFYRECHEENGLLDTLSPDSSRVSDLTSFIWEQAIASELQGEERLIWLELEGKKFNLYDCVGRFVRIVCRGSRPVIGLCYGARNVPIAGDVVAFISGRGKPNQRRVGDIVDFELIDFTASPSDGHSPGDLWLELFTRAFDVVERSGRLTSYKSAMDVREALVQTCYYGHDQIGGPWTALYYHLQDSRVQTDVYLAASLEDLILLGGLYAIHAEKQFQAWLAERQELAERT